MFFARARGTRREAERKTPIAVSLDIVSLTLSWSFSLDPAETGSV
jgi:hypothetical protein